MTTPKDQTSAFLPTVDACSASGDIHRIGWRSCGHESKIHKISAIHD